MCLNERTDCGKVKERGGGKERLGGGKRGETSNRVSGGPCLSLHTFLL